MINDKNNLQALEEEIKKEKRPGSGGKDFTYTPTDAVISRLNKVFGLSWNFEILREIINNQEVAVFVRVHYPTESGMCYKDGVAGKIREQKIILGNTLKAATSLALVKAASLMGVGGSDDEEDPNKPVSEDQKTEINGYLKQLNKKLFEAEQFSQMTHATAIVFIETLKDKTKKL